MSSEPAYPQSVSEIAEVIGVEKTVELIASFPPCGSRPWRVAFYVPKHMPLDHHLVRVLGYRLATRLSWHFGGEILQPSNCRFLDRQHRNRHIWRLHREGFRRREIADELMLPRELIAKVLTGKPPKDSPHDHP